MRDERLGLPPPLQVRHLDEPPAIPEADKTSGGATPDARRRPRRGERGPARRLRRPGVLQPRLQEAVRRPSAPRHLAAAQPPRTRRLRGESLSHSEEVKISL